MVCICCQRVVRLELDKLGLHYSYVNIGKAEIIKNLLPEQLEQLDKGFTFYLNVMLYS